MAHEEAAPVTHEALVGLGRDRLTDAEFLRSWPNTSTAANELRIISLENWLLHCIGNRRRYLAL